MDAFINKIACYWRNYSPYLPYAITYLLGICSPWLTRYFRMPKLQIVDIRQTARQSELRWLHLVIKMRKPWIFQLAEIKGCRASVTITSGTGFSQKRQLAWQTERGPSPRSGRIEPDDECLIPMFAKSSAAQFSLSALNGQYILSNRLTYITDSDGLINGNEVNPGASIQNDSLPAGLYKLRFEITKGRKRVNKGRDIFYLVVPHLSEDLDGLAIYPSW